MTLMLRVRHLGPLLLSALLGVPMANALAPVGVWWVAFPSLIGISYLFLTAETRRQAGWMGWAFATAYFATSLSWIVEPFFVDPVRHGWMAPFALIFMAGGLALFWGAAFWAAFALGRSPGPRLLALICCWSLAEFVRAYALTGFPWAAMAQFWTATEAMTLLAWIGPQGVAVLTLCAALPFGFALLPDLRPSFRAICVAPAAVFGILVLALGLTAPQTQMTGTTIRLVQPNASQKDKWHPDFVRGFFDRQVTYTAAKGDKPRPDLIVWPETAVPVLLDAADQAFETITQAAAGVPVVLGIQRRAEGRYYNSLVHLDATGAVAGTYDKHHLVPFGEYIPLGDLAARFGLTGFAAQQGDGFSPGPGPGLLGLGAVGSALPLICYEAVFPHHSSAAAGRADFLLQITNDAWFGQHSGPHQHLAQARMRAVEQGLPMIRVANTGISAMIDPLGRITHSLPLGRAGYLDAPLPKPLPRTLYARTGDWPVFIMLVALFLGLLGMQHRHRTLN